jgi:hypothetical protein
MCVRREGREVSGRQPEDGQELGAARAYIHGQAGRHSGSGAHEDAEEGEERDCPR